MVKLVDLVFCVEGASSITCDLNRVRDTIRSIINPICASYANQIRLSLVQFRSVAQHDDWLTKTYTYTRNGGVFDQWLGTIQAFGGSQDECEAVGDGLQEAVNITRYLHNNDEQSDKKLVVLITDGAPNGLVTLHDCTRGDRFSELTGADPWLVADEFKKQDMVLAILGIEPGAVSCDDFYCALAHKTGGCYIPFRNAARILVPVIKTAIVEEITFEEAFLGVQMADIEQDAVFKYSAVQQRVSGMLEECNTMADIQKWFFNRRSFY